MTEDWLLQVETICLDCDGRCCVDARPPLSDDCYARLRAEGVPQEFFDHTGYHHLRSRPDGSCICREGGKCTIHGIKPDTCRAGPFTFDVRGDTIEIFIKHEEICPLVRLLREVPAAYDQQYAHAVKHITHLVAHLPEHELGVICRIEEPDTVKIADIPRVRPERP